MDSFELPWGPEELTPELAELARYALQQQALEESNLHAHREELAVSVSPANGSDIEMADSPGASQSRGEERSVSKTAHHLSDRC